MAVSEDQVTDPDPVPAFECGFLQIGPDPDFTYKVRIRVSQLGTGSRTLKRVGADSGSMTNSFGSTAMVAIPSTGHVRFFF
jgi:hypothetical protein